MSEVKAPTTESAEFINPLSLQGFLDVTGRTVLRRVRRLERLGRLDTCRKGRAVLVPAELAPLVFEEPPRGRPRR